LEPVSDRKILRKAGAGNNLYVQAFFRKKAPLLVEACAAQSKGCGLERQRFAMEKTKKFTSEFEQKIKRFFLQSAEKFPPKFLSHSANYDLMSRT